MLTRFLASAAWIKASGNLHAHHAPLLVGELLQLGDVLGVQVAEASLQFQVFRYRPHALRTEAVIVLALLRIPLPDRVEAAFDDQPAEIDRARRLVDEALLARGVDHQVRRALVVEPLAHLVHQVDRVAHARGGHVAVRMAGRHHAREILGEQRLRFGNHRARAARTSSCRRRACATMPECRCSRTARCRSR